jgi:hypothetical protein
MSNYFAGPVYNCENGEDFFKALSDQIGKPKNMHTLALLSMVRLLVFLPESISNAVISPQAALPLMINHPEDIVRLIVKLRLQENV